MSIQDPTEEKRLSSYCIAEGYDLLKLADSFSSSSSCVDYGECLHVYNSSKDTDTIFFSYGVAVLWGHNQQDEKKIVELSRLQTINAFPSEKCIIESFKFTYGEQAKARRDLITLPSNSALQKVAASHGIAQSAILQVFEAQIQDTITKTKHLPQNLARKGKISLRRKEISQKMGQLFLDRSSINLHMDLLDTPEFFWEHDELERFYQTLREYLDISARLEILNQRLHIVHELFEMLGNELNHQHSSFLEWIIIWLIAIEIFFYLVKDVFNWL